MGIQVCFPVHEPMENPVLVFDELTDAGMALSEHARPVANRLSAEGTNLFIITGANQGGKSTYLRSIGLAQVFMQCGLFVTAAQYRASIRDAVFTHFPREEDAGMDHGRLEEELSRMDAIVRRLTSRSMLLLNESFATTTEREGAQIATDIVLALHERDVAVLYVTHLYEFALGMQDRKPEKTLFLRAERAQDGFRSFRIEPGEPLSTSYGEDLYAKIMAAT
jgi:DNA mismatch repair ATPase MutS